MGKGKSSAQNGAKKSAVNEAKAKDVTPSPTPFPISAFQLQSFSLSPVAHPAIVPVRNSRRCCRNARSCFNCRSTRDRRSSDGPVRAKFHESSRLASTRLNSRARTDRVNSLRAERICDRVVPGAGRVR